MASPASDFQKMISEARERKRNSALANKIFNRDRRQSAPSKLNPTRGGSLASRVGVKKQQRTPASTSNVSRRTSLPGDVNGEWTHDLHDSVNGAAQTAKGRSLSSRISNSNTLPRYQAQRRSKLASALNRMDVDQVNVVSSPARDVSSRMGLTIRGLAGPFAVMGQNFAPGTTAADIESAMTPVGGEMVSCELVKTSPFLMAEMVFSSREGGQRVIDTFDNKTADGRILKMYPKIGLYKTAAVADADERSNEPPPNAPSGPKNPSATRSQYVDGSMGFPDLMDRDDRSENSGGASHRLYSDNMVSGGNRRGRGFRSRNGQ